MKVDLVVQRHMPTMHDWRAWNRDPVNFPVAARYQFRINPDTGKPLPGTGHVIPGSVAPGASWASIDRAVVHYTADDDLIDGDPGENYNRLGEYIYSIHRMYCMQRAYSVGYNWFVDYLGGIWTGRGWAIRNAANAGTNDESFSICCLVDGQDATTEAADLSIRWLIWQGERLAQRELLISGHGDVGATQCPGSGIRAKIASGRYSPRYGGTDTGNETPWNPTLQNGDEMPTLVRITDNGQPIDLALFIVNGTMVEWCSTQERANSLSFMQVLDSESGPGTVPPKPVPVDRGFLQYYTLIGAAPVYPSTYTGPKTSPADFGRWVQ